MALLLKKQNQQRELKDLNTHVSKLISQSLLGQLNSTCQNASPDGPTLLESNSASFAVEVLDPPPVAQSAISPVEEERYSADNLLLEREEAGFLPPIGKRFVTIDVKEAARNFDMSVRGGDPRGRMEVEEDVALVAERML